MNLDQFKNWAVSQGSVAKTNGQYAGECVSLINQYLFKVYGMNAGAWGNAKDWATNGTVATIFDKVSSPQAGDVGISGATSTNPYGHIWIYLSPNQVLEQNGKVARSVSVNAPLFKPIAILRKKGTKNNMQPITSVEVNNLLGALWGVQTNPYATDYNSKDRANDHRNLDGKPFYEAFSIIYQDPRTFEYADKVYKALHSSGDQFEEAGTVLDTKLYKKRG
jgi:hypothetical protein